MTAWVLAMDRVEESLRCDPRLGTDSVRRPHALLVTVWRIPVATDGRVQPPIGVVFAPAVVWDDGRDLLAAFADRLAEGTVLFVLVGPPSSSTLRDGVKGGLASVVACEATVDDLYLATHRAFELLESRGRAESRGRSLQRYRYERSTLQEVRSTRQGHRHPRHSASRTGISMESSFASSKRRRSGNASGSRDQIADARERTDAVEGYAGRGEGLVDDSGQLVLSRSRGS